MAYSDNHILLAWGGTLFDSEVWNNTVRLAFTAPAAETNCVSWAALNAAGAHAKLKTWFNANASLWSTSVKFGWSKLNAIGVDGRYVDKDNSNTVLESPEVAGTGTATLPGQIAMCLTWVTNAQRGLAHSGKLYLPILTGNITVGTDGLLPTTNRDFFPPLAKSLADSLNALPPDASLGVPKLHVMSGTRAGAKQRITGVKCGRVIDTQRRRRSNLSESYSAISTIS